MTTYEEMRKAQARIKELEPIVNKTLLPKFFDMDSEFTEEEEEYFGLEKEVKGFLDSHPVMVTDTSEKAEDIINCFATYEEADAFIEANKPNNWISFTWGESSNYIEKMNEVNQIADKIADAIDNGEIDREQGKEKQPGICK